MSLILDSTDSDTGMWLKASQAATSTEAVNASIQACSSQRMSFEFE